MQQHTVVYFLVLLLCDLIYQLDARRCYVCGRNVDESVNGSSDITEEFKNCTNLENLWKNDEKIRALNEFTMDCPSEYGSCLFQKDAKQKTIIRSCEKFELNDCQSANSVTYCYCTTDFCNDENVPDQPQIINIKEKRKIDMLDENTDDEDLTNDDEESSGSREQISQNNNLYNKKSSEKTKNTTGAGNVVYADQLNFGFSILIGLTILYM